MGKDDFCKHSNFQTDNKHNCMWQVNNCREICIKMGKGTCFYVDDPRERKLVSQVHTLPCIQNALKRFLNLRILKKGNIRYSSWAINCNLQNKMYKSKV